MWNIESAECVNVVAFVQTYEIYFWDIDSFSFFGHSASIAICILFYLQQIFRIIFSWENKMA